MAHLHQVVVHDVCQVVGGQVVGTLVEHLVVENGRVDGHIATNEVVYHHVASWFNLEAHHIVGAGVDEFLHFLGRKRERVAHTHTSGCVVLEVLDFATLCVEFFGGVECDIRLAVVEQLLHILPYSPPSATPSSMPMPSQ